MQKDTILVVDDQPNNLKVVAGILGDEYSLSIADSGAMALKVLERLDPQLILLDIMMPEMDGYAVCREIKLQKRFAEVPVIFVSARSETIDIVKGFEAGGVDYIANPFQRMELQARISTHLKLYHAIQEKKTAESNLRSVLENQKEYICRYTHDLTLTYVNSTLAQMLDDEPDNLAGKNLCGFVSETSQSTLRDAIASLTADPSGSYLSEEETFDREGKTHWIEWTTYAILDTNQNISAFQSVGYDITDRVEKQRLEREIEITRKTLEFKQNFMASISHEMRTPLTAIVGIAEILRNAVFEPRLIELLTALDISTSTLTQVIDQLLDYSGLEAGKVYLKYQNASLSELAKDAEEFFNSICNKPISFAYHIDEILPDILRFDRIRIFQVVKNLVINAVRFSQSGTISLKIDKTDEEKPSSMFIRVEVTDMGVGIREEKHETLFNAFTDVDKINSAEYQGIGLGLAFCREVVDRHNGTIGIKSKPEAGTTIWFTFEAFSPEEIPDENYDPAKNPFENRNLNLLLVEDKVITQKVATLLLGDMGHTIHIANHGLEALEKFRPGMFDMILMDIQMPVMDGITATKKLRDLYKGLLPPIVGHSANVFEGDREKYMSLGMDEYLTKPLTQDSFRDLVRRMAKFTRK
ncbi:MAG: response regulator [Bacteroidota bacterium]